MQSQSANSSTFPRPNTEDRSKRSEQKLSVSVHDLNNKLGVILTRCELMTSRSSLDSKSIRDVQAIHDAAEAIAGMLGSDRYTECEVEIVRRRVTGGSA